MSIDVQPAPAPRRARELSLVARLSLLAILPASLIAVLLAVLLNHNHHREIEHVVSAAADAAAGNLAAAAAAAMTNDDRAALAQIAEPLADNEDLVRVQFLSRDGEILAEASGPAERSQPRFVEVTSPVAAATPGAASPGRVRIRFGLGRMDDIRRRQTRATALLLVACLTAAGVAGWRAARRVSAPVLALADAVDRLGRGARGVSVPVTRGGEIGHLQRGFNAASVALTEAWDELEARIAAATDELARKNAKLEAASHARARFLAAASHDLRQPLYALTLFSSALKAGETDPGRLARASHIQECVATLDGLFSELLDLSRLESGTMQPSPSDFPLDPLLEDVNRTFRMIAEKRELRLVLRKTDAWVHTDRTMLARIVNNLVSNALRYTERGGVLVGVRAAGTGHVRIEVWDTGPGIAPEHQARVFEEFFQVESARSERGPREHGMGLGLATAHRLAHLLGSELELHSRLQLGSMFGVTVPRAHAEAHTRAADAQRDAPLDASGLRVLVIDDEPTILEGMRVLMHSWDCDMRAAEDAEQALAAVRGWGPPDIVLSDLKLARGRTGLEALRRLEAHYGVPEGASPPFARLLITGETKGERLHEANEARVPVLHKPVAPERLREAMIAAVLASQRTDDGTPTVN
ncbi:hybrid sensor histidine kinase/response regulator [Luteimonas sp. SJ-92]|uniref:histidine kinase n=1 Tax=Luteimonas salinisoli TaxID=2752307 RepID=A0A853JGQ9_9GAMM|nr:hybrid sensor histidine kinase/response regulator [Luteimonas salinisoli]NZA28591.1 hybrid sensor histidine kinase/response regulator [Luteimonas salinisoli]